MINIFQHYMNKKIGNRIIAVVIFICVLQMTGSMIIYGISYKGRKQEIIEQNIRILEQANNNYLAAIVNEMVYATRELFYDEIFWSSQGQGEAEGEIYSILANNRQSLVDVDSIYLYSGVTNKLYIMDEISFLGLPVKTLQTNTFVSGYEELSQTEWFLEAAEKNGNMAVTRNQEIREGEKEIISFSRYLRHPLNKQGGYYAVSINIDESRFRQLEEQLCEDGEMLFVLEEVGNCIYSGENGRLRSCLDEWKIGDESGWFKTKIDNIRYIGVSNTAQEYPWTMIKLTPEKMILNAVVSQMIGNCLIILLFFLVGFFILQIVIRRITQPITNLAGMMRNYIPGAFVKDSKLAARQDEVGILYQSYEKMNGRINQLIESEYKSQILEKQARLEALQAQIDPHFLYNTLQTISGIAIEKNIYEIEEINNSLSKILRYSLNKRKSLVKLQEELINVQNYMDIQKYRFGEKIRLEINLSEEILGCLVPVFTLQLAVENAIKHGLEAKIGSGIIKIYDEIESEKTRCLYVQDDGKGISEERLEEIRILLENPSKNVSVQDSKGLINLNERIKNQFGKDYGVKLENNENEGALLIIRIPF